MELVTSKLKISVPNPCSQLWENMDPTQNGRYCHHCEKEVIDFTTMSNSELEAWFSAAKGKVCGQFTLSQFGNKNLPVPNNWKTIRTKILALSFLTFGASLKANAIIKNVEKIACHEQKRRAVQIEIQELEIFRTDTTVIVKGKLISGNDKLPLVGIMVSHKGGKQSVISSERGSFLIELPVITNQKIILNFSHLGVETKEVEISDAQINPVNIVASKIERRMSIAGGAVAIIKRVPWYKRTWNYIKRLL